MGPKPCRRIVHGYVKHILLKHPKSLITDFCKLFTYFWLCKWKLYYFLYLTILDFIFKYFYIKICKKTFKKIKNSKAILLLLIN